MTAGLALGAVLSHWRRHPVQLAMLLIGLALATGLWTGVQAINAEARASYADAAALLGQDRLARLEPAGGAWIEESDYVALRRAGWLVSPVVEGRATFGDRRVTLLGIDPLTQPPQATTDAIDQLADLAAFITPPGFGYAAPETVAGIAAPFRVEPAEGLPPVTILVDIGTAQRLLGAEGRLSRLLLWAEQPPGVPPLAVVAPNLRLAEPEGTGELERLTDSFHLNLTAFGFLSFIVGLFIVHSAVGLAFEQRRPMFRTLRSLGVPARILALVLLVELLLLALTAGAAGVGLGYLVAALLMPDVAATLGGLYGAPVEGRLALRPEWWAAGFGIALAGALIAGVQGLWRVWRLPVLAPAGHRAWARASERALTLQGGGAVALALAALALALRGSGLLAGFALLGALLLSAALALPVLLVAILAAARRHVRGVLPEWFLADTRQQVPGLSLALMALLLALAANVGVGTMVSSFRLTFTGWLDQRLAAELYVTARDEAEAEALRAFLTLRSDAVLPVWRSPAPLSQGEGTVYAVADHATYRDNWPLLAATPDAWDRVAEGTGVLVNEQFARREGLQAGQPIPLPGGALPVVGIYSDYGNPGAQAMIAVDAFRARFPEAPRLQHAIRVAPDRTATLAQEVADHFGLPPQNATDQASVKAMSLAVFDRTFTVTAALNVLTLGVAAIALLASLVTLSGMRLPQLAPVWAMGLTRARLARLELLRTLLLAALTMLAALPVGLLLAWVLLAIINVEAFGWRLPMHLFPGDWLRLAGLALLAAAIAAALPARRLARTAPAELLRVFANER